VTGGIAPLLLVPAAGVLLTTVVRGRTRALLGLVLAAVTALAAVDLAAGVGRAQLPGRLVLRGPFDVEVVLVADGLAAVMLAMTAVVAVAVLGFATAEDRRVPERRHAAYWPLMLALWAGLNVLFLAGDLLTAYLMLELVGLCGALLVTLRGGQGSLLAGTRYFYAELVASTTMLLGVGLVWWQAGTVTFTELAATLDAGPLTWLGLAVVTVGLLLKVPLAPLHFWLPAAHTLAPSAVSPLLSAVMVKAAFAVVARLWFLAVPELITVSGAQLLGAIGTVAILWGSFAALRATGLKRLIASSTVAQLGLLFLLPPLVAAGAVDGWTGGVVLAVAHALAKAALLMAAAVIVDAARRAGMPTALATGGGPGPRDPASGSHPPSVEPVRDAGWPVLTRLRGSASRRPVAVMAFGIAGLSLVGLPPTGGFVAKWYLLLGSIAAGQWWWAVVIVVGTLLTVGYLMRFIRPAFAPLPAGEVGGEHDARDLIALALAATTLVIGLRPTLLLDVLTVGGPSVGG
jgi:multicomponent Na+:H+ antiporter subunit D